MRISKLIVVIVVGLAAAGCNTTSQVEQRAADEARCRGYGFKRSTDAYAKCRLQLDLDRSADRRARFNSPYFYGGGFYGGRGWGWNRYWW